MASLRWWIAGALAAPGCGAPTPGAGADVAARFRDLHAPIYEVYGLGDAGAPEGRDRLWEHLAARFAGEALTDEYVEHFTTLARLRREQTTVAVEAVDYEAVEVLALAPGAAELEAGWLVRGEVTHRGHSHQRVNRYRAAFRLEETAAGLRIVRTRLRDLQRLPGELPGGAGERLTPAELLRQGGAP